MLPIHARAARSATPLFVACVALLLASTGACGGQAAPPAAAPASAPAPTPAAAPESASAAVPASPAPPPNPGKGSASPDGVVYDEMDDPTSLKPLFEKGAPPTFPAATTSELDCWQSVSVSGTARKDYETITAKCGTSTGSVEYVKPTLGKLHSKHDKRDTFIVPIHGGFCYRFFGVADSTISDLDILVEKKGGALVGDDKTNGPVAIIESNKAWCFDSDGVYDFLVEVDGQGQGDYVFGIWVRKNKK